MVAQTRDEHGLPRRGLVSLGEGLASLGLLLGILVVPLTLPPETYAATLALVLVGGLVLIRGAGRLAIGWTSAAEIITSAVGLGWTRPGRAACSLLALALGLALAAWLAGQGGPLAGLIGAALALSPARWWLPRGASRERARTGIEKALAGVLAGGLEWDKHEADLRGAPVRVRFAADATPDRVSYHLPPNWRAAQTEDLEGEIKERLSKWGTWLVDIRPSDRWAVAERVDPLPERLDYTGEVATDRGEVTVGMARLSRRAAKARGQRYGSTLPFVWDARVAPHGLVVGTTGAGKSSTVCVLVTAWLRNPRKRAVLLDPAGVEFGPYRGRQGVLHVAEEVESMTEALREVMREMQRRLDLCNAAGVKNVWSLPPDQRPPSWLVVVDEVMDYFDKSPAQTDEAKAENNLRAEASDMTQRLEQKARKVDIHLVLAGQRLDKNVVSGRTQNNSPFRCLTGVQEAEPTERRMIGLYEVEPEDGVAGRGVAKTVKMPESEVQFTYLEPDDMPDWLPMDDTASREWLALTSGDVQSRNGDDDQDQTEDKPSPGRGSNKRQDREDGQDGIEQKPEPGSGESQTPDEDESDPRTEGGPGPGPGPDPGIDPLDFWEEED